VLCEGPRGTLAKQLEPQLGLMVGRNPQVYATGVKELWEMPAGRVQKGRVIHTMGYPLPNGHVRRRLHLRDDRPHVGGGLRSPDSTRPIPPAIRTGISSASRLTRS
jgi:electron-transferring-flavoprotein dehydrogenase